VKFSVVIPVYESHATIERCLAGLESLRHPSFEVIFVDSSPNDLSSSLIRKHPRFTLLRSERRLLMHAARNLGIRAASGDTIVFTDPDCVVAPDWLSILEESLVDGRAVVGGSIALFPGNSIDVAAHVVKFWRWSPGRKERIAEDLATANFAVRKTILEEAGEFDADLISGDTELSHRLRRLGCELRFNSRAVVHHIHNATFKGLIKERYVRGVDFGRMRAKLPVWTKWKSFMAIAAAPLLALRQAYWQYIAARSQGLRREFLRSAAIILCADAVWMLGTSIGYMIALRERDTTLGRTLLAGR
jgi:GT2 family glycosyltransferase